MFIILFSRLIKRVAHQHLNTKIQLSIYIYGIINIFLHRHAFGLRILPDEMHKSGSSFIITLSWTSPERSKGVIRQIRKKLTHTILIFKMYLLFVWTVPGVSILNTLLRRYLKHPTICLGDFRGSEKEYSRYHIHNHIQVTKSLCTGDRCYLQIFSESLKTS